MKQAYLKSLRNEAQTDIMKLKDNIVYLTSEEAKIFNDSEKAKKEEIQLIPISITFKRTDQ